MISFQPSPNENMWNVVTHKKWDKSLDFLTYETHAQQKSVHLHFWEKSVQ